MNHQKLRELLSLSLYEELGEADQKTLNEHLAACEKCRVELESLKKLHVVMGSPSVPVSDDLLEEARVRLRTALRNERTRPTFREKLSRSLSSIFGAHAAAWSGALALVIGLLVGHFFLGPKPILEVKEPPPIGRPDPGDMQIANVKFIDSNASDGQVEFTFDAVKPMHIKGSINDPTVQNVLTHAIVNEENPGTRLTAVSTLDRYQPKSADPEVKAALIKAVLKDPNPAVRQQALGVLGKFPFDTDIKKAFLQVLLKDTNSGMRIEAIKALEGKKVTDQDFMDVMKKKADEDPNPFVRLKANAILREVKD